MTSDAHIKTNLLFGVIMAIATTGVISMTIEMCIIPATPASLRGCLITQLITLFSSFSVFLVMFDAIRRLNNLKGKHLIIDIKHFALLFTTFILFLGSGVFFVVLF